MTILYDIIFILFSIVYLPYLLFTGRYHRDFWQRFGFYPKDVIGSLKDKKIIWVHTVSVGEVMAARILCESILVKFPQRRLVISTITKTGNDIAKKFFKDEATILYLPVDISFLIDKVLNKIGLELFIIVETEIWPNLITALHKHKIPILLVNGRISPKSYISYMRVKFLIKAVLQKITLFCMQSDEYAHRIRNMGAPADKVVVTGNMKFDAANRVSMHGKLDIDTIRDDLNLKEDHPFLIGGSTHNPEEKILLSVYKDLLKDYPNLKLLIAPRHIERTQEIENLIRKSGFDPLRISEITNRKPRTAPRLRSGQADRKPTILILDTMGRLSQLFSIATIVFMGGSLKRKGGQNILEPAVFSKPIVFGPHMFNFKDITETFLGEDAACMVKGRDELLKTIGFLLKDTQRREELGSHAKLLIEKNIGTTRRNIEEIGKILKIQNF